MVSNNCIIHYLTVFYEKLKLLVSLNHSKLLTKNQFSLEYQITLDFFMCVSACQNELLTMTQFYSLFFVLSAGIKNAATARDAGCLTVYLPFQLEHRWLLYLWDFHGGGKCDSIKKIKFHLVEKQKLIAWQQQHQHGNNNCTHLSCLKFCIERVQAIYKK